MTVMNEEKECPGNSKDVSKKICPRAARENSKRKSEGNSLKTAHTGLRFHFDKKKLVTNEFSFNSVSKTEKVSKCRSQEKSVEKQKTGAGSSTTESKKIEVLMDTLKISKSEESGRIVSREKSPSRKEIPKSPVVERLTSKKICTRCTRCSKSPKEEKPEIKALKVAKNQNPSPKTIRKENQAAKTVKVETPQSPKTITCKKQCSKLARLLEEPHDKILKPKSILKHAEKSASGDKEKTDISKNCERTLHAEKPKSCSTDKGKSHCKNEEKTEFAWPKSGKAENVTFVSEIPNSDTHDKEKSEIINGPEHPAASDTVACLLNGTRHDEHVCDPHFGYESSDVGKKELESVKSASKIPRKTNDAAGPKSDASLNKSIPQPLIMEV